MKRSLLWFWRHIGAFAFVMILVVSYTGLRAWTTETRARVNEDARQVLEIKRACVSFVTAHNGLIDDDVATLQVAKDEHGSFPGAAEEIQARIDAYNSHKVSLAACFPNDGK